MGGNWERKIGRVNRGRQESRQGELEPYLAEGIEATVHLRSIVGSCPPLKHVLFQKYFILYVYITRAYLLSLSSTLQTC